MMLLFGLEIFFALNQDVWYRCSVVRIDPNYWNTKEEIDEVVNLLNQISQKKTMK